MSIEVGQQIKFLFHGFGVVSHVHSKVTDIKDNIITLSDGESNYKFNLTTGMCLNDNTHMGCKRTLSDEYIIPNWIDFYNK